MSALTLITPLLKIRNSLIPAVLLSIFSIATTSLFAQRIELGVSGGAFNYKGDIATKVNPRFFRPGGGAFFRYNLNKAVTFRAAGTGGIITAADQYSKDPFQKERNLAFRSRVMELSLATEYNFLDYSDRRFAVNWTPYLFGGLGYMFFSPSTKTGTYKTNGLVLPFGVGVKYQIRRPWSVGLELGARKTFNDYLDNLGGDPVTKIKLGQGDPSTKDMYYYLGLSISYTFYKITCPE